MSLTEFVDRASKEALERFHRSLGQRVRYAKRDLREAVTLAVASLEARHPEPVRRESPAVIAYVGQE